MSDRLLRVAVFVLVVAVLVLYGVLSWHNGYRDGRNDLMLEQGDHPCDGPRHPSALITFSDGEVIRVDGRGDVVQVREPKR